LEQTRSTSGDLKMDGGNLLFDLPPAPGGRSGQHARNPPPRRPQAIRDTIMAFLIEPHTVKEIAIGIDKTTSTVTGHLRAMRRKDLVVRLSWGVWVRRDKNDAPPDHASIRRPNPAQERLLSLLTEPKTLAELQEITKRRGDILLAILMKLIKRGDIEHRADERFAAVPK
jgi:DNA-binding transcriptional ArsR family regulator